MVKLVKGQNDLLSQYPACINEWDFNKNHPLSPDAVVAGSSKKSGGFVHGDIPMSKLLNGGRDVEVHATTAQGIKC